jgi:hypothetical protein
MTISGRAKYVNVKSVDGKKNRKGIPFITVLKDLWSNTVFKIGIICLVFGIPFSIPFVSNSGIFSTSFDQNDPVAVGFITYSEGTDAKVGEIEVFEYKYRYELPDGRIFFGTGYCTGDSLKRGSEVSVRYKEKDPTKSETAELRNSMFGESGAVIGLGFPVFGLISMIFGMKKLIRQISILKIGEMTYGRLLNKEATNLKIDKRTVYKLTFEFTASDNIAYQVVAKSNDTNSLTDDKLEKLVYDPAKPERFVLIDALPYRTREYYLKMNKTR